MGSASPNISRSFIAILHAFIRIMQSRLDCYVLVQVQRWGEMGGGGGGEIEEKISQDIQFRSNVKTVFVYFG